MWLKDSRPPDLPPDAVERLMGYWKDLLADQNYSHVKNADEYTLAEDVQPKVVREYFPQGQYLLFLGCGCGLEVKWARDNGYRAEGITLNPNNITFAKERWGIDLHYGDMHFLPWGDETFDGVLAFQTVEHSPSPIILCMEVKRALKPGGVFYFETPDPTMWTDNFDANLLHHITCPIPMQARAWFKKTGYSSGIAWELNPLGSGASRYMAALGRKV